MAKLVIVLFIFCALAAHLVKGLDFRTILPDFEVKMEECKVEVRAKYPDIEEGKCMRSCLMKKYDMMDDNGKFVKEVALIYGEKYADGSDEKMKTITEIIEKCSEIEFSDDHCEAAEQVVRCLGEEGKALFN